MLYIDNERVTDLKKYIAKLKEVFPSSFTSTPNPIKINVAKRHAKYVSVFKRGATDDPIGQRQIVTPPSISSGKAWLTDNGVRKQVVYTRTYPTQNKVTGAIEYTNTGIELKNGMVIDVERDLEKLIFLYFYSPEFTNGALAKKSAKYEFYIPAIQARETMGAINLSVKYGKELIDNSGQEFKDYTWVKAMYNSLAINSTNEEETDRLQLYDLVVKNESWRERYERARLNIEALSKKDGSNRMNDISDVIKLAKKNKVLVEEGGLWVLTANDTNRTLTEVRGTTAAEKQLGLVEWLITQPEEEKDLREAVNVSLV